jgi:ribonucleoside-diphosphate reductase alpha chain
MSKLLKYFKGDELAASVWAGKYKMEGEETPDDMHKRMAKEFARVEEDYFDVENAQWYVTKGANLSRYGQTRKRLTEERIYQMFKDFKYISPQGSIMSMLGNKAKVGSLSNCFVVGQPHDSYGGIMQKDEQLAQLMKRRGGVGIDISTLRPDTVVVSNAAGSSTGAVSFMERFSNTTREVAQKGRRGALMITIDCRHPDVFDFVNVKKDRTKVTGANISVNLRDDFMEAVKNDEDYILRFPCDLELTEDHSAGDYNVLVEEEGIGYLKKIRAKELYDSIAENAWENAEPGQMFIDRHWNYSPDAVYSQYKGVTTNPCGEIFMQEYDACRLMALNLFSFVKNPFTDEAGIDLELLYKMAYEQQRLADDLVDLELEHIDRIITKINADKEPMEVKRTELELWKNIKKVAASGRRTGCGFTALGDMLAALRVKYDSIEGKAIIEQVMATKMEGELDCTIDLAVTRGPFDGWDSTLELEEGIEDPETMNYGNDFYMMLWEKFEYQANRMKQHGRRNVSWSTVAPTGSVSILTQTTSGLEPLFMPYYMRRKKVNPGEQGVRVDFTDQNGDNWMEYPILHTKFRDWLVTYLSKVEQEDKPNDVNTMTNEELEVYFKISPWYGSTANDIDWLERVEIQAIIQKYTTHSISSTINLPSTATQKDVSEIYMAAYKAGLKGVTVYRDGSRTGVLVNNNSTKEETFEYKDAVKRPRELDAEVHWSISNGVAYKVIVGMLNSKPYEVFIDESEEKYTGNGVSFKKSKGSYFFKQNDISYDITSYMTDEQEAITRLASGMLRHGSDIKYVVEQLNKVDGELFSFTKSLARVLKKYIPEGAKSTVSCEDCGSEDVIFEEGCSKCRECGSSKCG